MIDLKYALTFSDQPITCPKCGARTEITLDLSHTYNQIQMHQCLFPDCQNEFVVAKDDEPVEGLGAK
jgi:hypothetical protein